MRCPVAGGPGTWGGRSCRGTRYKGARHCRPTWQRQRRLDSVRLLRERFHTVGQERGGVSLRAGGTSNVQHSCGWPWWSGHQWPWWPLVTCSLPCQVQQVSWMTHRRGVSWENPPLPLFLPSSPSSPAGQPEVGFLASFPWGPKLWPCFTLDRLAFQQMPPQGVHTAD